MKESLIRELGIKTPEGVRLFKRALEQSGRIQAEREKHEEGSKEFKRLTKKDVQVMADALAEARTLNPKPKKKAVGKLRFR